MRPTLILLSDAETKMVILERLRAAGEYRPEPVFDRLTVGDASFGVDPTDAVLAEYDAGVLEQALPSVQAHAVMLEYGVREDVRQLVLAVTEGLHGVLDTNYGPYLRFGDLPGSRWLARPGHPESDSSTGEPLAIFEEQPDELGDPMIWPRWTGFGESDAVTESRRSAVLAELRRELVRRHPLFGRITGIEAFHAASDDVLARLDDGTLAVVHPTWSGNPEHSENCPSFVIQGKASEAAQRFRTYEGWVE
ncbi:hypothetical protein ACH47X_07995 [Promicromonospora kroppenstedtii]|uniref:Uncharacterized protein n=1 Tax=Promicromonospora kroppenstedtii TaxID=440482 RepID=A0ABW7XH43_9MICO